MMDTQELRAVVIAVIIATHGIAALLKYGTTLLMLLTPGKERLDWALLVNQFCLALIFSLWISVVALTFRYDDYLYRWLWGWLVVSVATFFSVLWAIWELWLARIRPHWRARSPRRGAS